MIPAMIIRAALVGVLILSGVSPADPAPSFFFPRAGAMTTDARLIQGPPGGPFTPKVMLLADYLSFMKAHGVAEFEALWLAALWLGLPSWQIIDGPGPILARIPG